MPNELPKSYEPGAIETRWAEYWIKEKLFSLPAKIFVGSRLLALHKMELPHSRPGSA